MTYPETQKIINLFETTFGEKGKDTAKIWHKLCERYDYDTVRVAAWELTKTSKWFPKPADLFDLIQAPVVGGGAQQRKHTDCIWCHGGGWAQVEKEYGQIICMRCTCQAGNMLSAKHTQLTDDIRKSRRLDLFGRLMLPNPAEAAKDAEFAEMSIDEMRTYCNKLSKEIGRRL